MQILSTKLIIPPLRSGLVTRPRLIQKLNLGLECGFVLVSAPAGYGKSTLLSAWLRQAEVPAVWYSLDEGDNDPVRFLTYLSATLSKIQPEVTDILNFIPPSSPLTAVEIPLTALINQLAQVDTPFWLVLDDYHLIQNLAVQQMVGFLREHRPPSFHMAISTRADPSLPLSRMRACSQMVELRLADLRFSLEETSQFLCQSMGLDLSAPDLAILASRTEGWVAGLQLAGLSLQSRDDPTRFIQTFDGENQYILEYLFQEVFQRQPADIRTFLLQTSILDSLCGPLCDEVTQHQDSQTVLETLEQNNLFLIRLDEQRKWYRYHHLFINLLKNNLQQTSPETSATLHKRASAWYAVEGNLENAIAHALAGADFSQAANLIEQAVRTLDFVNQQTLLTGWMDCLPRDVLTAYPWLCAYRAYGYYWIGRRDMEEEWLKAAETALERTIEIDISEQQHIQGFIAAIRAHTALVVEDVPRALEMGKTALDLLPEHDAMRSLTAVALGAVYWARGEVVNSEKAFQMAQTLAIKTQPSIAVSAACYLGVQQVKQGRLDDALSTFHESLHLATALNGNETLIAGFPNVKLGDVWRERNLLILAEQHLTRGLEQCLQLKQVDFLTDAYVCLGRYYLPVGDLPGAHAALLQADLIARQSQVDQWVLCGLDDCHLKTWLAEGNLAAVKQWAESCGLTSEGPLSYLHDLHHLNLARAWVILGSRTGDLNSLTQAAALLTRLQSAARQAGWVHEEIKILVLQAVNDQARECRLAALHSLSRAISLAEPGGYVQVFLDEGKPMQELLRALAEGLNSGGSLWDQAVPDKQQMRIKNYLAALLSAFDRPATASTNGPSANQPILSKRLFEPLSAREMDVLNLLAQGCSDKQVATALTIATGTVNKHLKNIYGKLDVHSRTEALARARALGWQ